MIKDIKILFILLFLVGVFLISLMTYGNYKTIVKSNQMNILISARTNAQEMVIFRHWVGSFGGVYVPMDNIEPNPYLIDKNRDIETIRGQKLTLVNPAWMTRQVFELGSKDSKTKKRIISNIYLNPVNKPNKWESNILNIFQKDSSIVEYYEFKNTSLKYMKTLSVEQQCIKCHPDYKGELGETRGALSFDIDLTQYNLNELTELTDLYKRNFIIFIILSLLLFLMYYVLTKIIKDNEQKNQQMLHQSRLALMGEMIGMIAHQWRQPLNAISLTSGNLKFKCMMDDYNKEVFEEEIDLIDNYAQHLSKTIDDFRGFFEENKTKELTSLEELTNSVLDIVSKSIENNNIKLTVDFNCNTEFKTYANEIKQVILNIIKNAEDILLEKKIENGFISIETHCLTKDKRTLIIKDNAGGIPEDIINKIFEPYFSTKKEKDGTGLGLYMSKTIIEEHCEGKLSVENDNYGAVFTVTL